MNAEQFAYWLRGAVESRNFDNITLEEAKVLLKSIQDHSALPFKKVTPELSKKDQDLNELIKKAAQKPITPAWPNSSVNHPPFFPEGVRRPSFDYDRPGYWLDKGVKPGELYC